MGWVFGTGAIVEWYPLWAWNHGTKEMQRRSMESIVRTIHSGDAMHDVVQKLGHGARGGMDKHRVADDDFRAEGRIAFVSRFDANFGIIVTFQNGRVINAEAFD